MCVSLFLSLPSAILVHVPDMQEEIRRSSRINMQIEPNKSNIIKKTEESVGGMGGVRK